MFSNSDGSGSRPAVDRPQGMYMYGGVGVGAARWHHHQAFSPTKCCEGVERI